MNINEITAFPSTVSQLLDHPDWDAFQGNKLGNDLFLSDPDRASRNWDAAENGCDGSTHAEHIEDWREFAEQLKDDANRAISRADDETQGEEVEETLRALYESLQADIERCETWHQENGSLHSQCG